MKHTDPLRGIILFAHGSRDPLWHKPIEAVAALIATQSPATQVVCAYLELSTPDLAAATQTLLDRGVRSITLLPMFLGVGKHSDFGSPANSIRTLLRRYAITHAFGAYAPRGAAIQR